MIRSFFLGLCHLVLLACNVANAQQCDICGGNSLPEVNLRINVGDATIASCEASLDPTFCSLLGFFDGFTCGEIQFNPALAFEFCELFQVTLGVACNCNGLNPINDPVESLTEPPSMPQMGRAPVERATAAISEFMASIMAFFDRIFG